MQSFLRYVYVLWANATFLWENKWFGCKLKQRFGSKCNVFRQTLKFLRETLIFCQQIQVSQKIYKQAKFLGRITKYLPSNVKLTNAMFYEIVKVLRTKAKFLGEDRIQKRVNATFLWNHIYFANKCRFSGEYNYFYLFASERNFSRRMYKRCQQMQSFYGDCKHFLRENTMFLGRM